MLAPFLKPNTSRHVRHDWLIVVLLDWQSLIDILGPRRRRGGPIGDALTN